MSSFDERQKTAEKKFVLEAQQEFKAEARRNKKLAIWAGELMGKNEDAIGKYVSEVIIADMEEAGDDDVFRKLRKDLDDAGVELSDAALREKMDAFHQEAREEIFNEG